MPLVRRHRRSGKVVDTYYRSRGNTLPTVDVRLDPTWEDHAVGQPNARVTEDDDWRVIRIVRPTPLSMGTSKDLSRALSHESLHVALRQIDEGRASHTLDSLRAAFTAGVIPIRRRIAPTGLYYYPRGMLNRRKRSP